MGSLLESMHNFVASLQDGKGSSLQIFTGVAVVLALHRTVSHVQKSQRQLELQKQAEKKRLLRDQYRFRLNILNQIVQTDFLYCNTAGCLSVLISWWLSRVMRIEHGRRSLRNRRNIFLRPMQRHVDTQLLCKGSIPIVKLSKCFALCDLNESLSFLSCSTHICMHT